MPMTIGENVKKILAELPEGVELVAAAKTKQPEEILEAVMAGVRNIGENYLQETERAYQVVGDKVTWHLIGHLQRNKVKRAVGLFNMIQTVDSVAIAREIDKRCGQIGKVMSILVEVNIGREKQKSGISPEDVEQLTREISVLPNVSVMGLMTMAPLSMNPEDSRPYFAKMRKLFNRIGELNLAGVEMRYLSMGMTDTYRVAVEEGANMVRIGSMIFGRRDYGEGS